MKDAVALRRLARAHGVQTRYDDADGVRRHASLESLLPVLRALGAPIERLADATRALAEHEHAAAAPGCEPAIVAWDGLLDRIPVRTTNGAPPDRVRIETEEAAPFEIAGERLRVTGRDGSGLRLENRLRLPLGYHRLEVALGAERASALIIAAPRRAPVDVAEGWGLFLPLHALRTDRDWGVGDYGALERFIRWATAQGASFTGTLPLLPMFLDSPFEPSPYAPISRRFWGELYIDVEAVPHFDAACDLTDSDRTRLDEARDADQVDYRAVAAIKMKALNAAAARFFDGGAADRDFHDFLRDKPEARDYSRFRAACDARGAGWERWPEHERHGCLADDSVPPADLRRHLFATWVADRQLRRAARAASAANAALYLDLPLGVHRHGFDTWRERGLFADDASVGAPPDPLFRGGQNWGFPPMNPIALRRSGYASLIATLRHHLGLAKLLRLDHVMAVQRLFWIPSGAAAPDGVYVRYPTDELMAIHVLEASRHEATLIGEDLGTVSAAVRTAMRRRSVQRMFVVQYEADARRDPPLPQPAPDAMASLNTHDMPPFAAYWAGADIDDQRARGWISVAEHDAARSLRHGTTRAVARQLGLRHAGADTAAAARDALHERLAAGPAPRTVINLEDLWLEARPQNVPGTPSGENWRRKAAMGFDAMCRAAEPALRSIRFIRTA